MAPAFILVTILYSRHNLDELQLPQNLHTNSLPPRNPN
jgi:hypothetical protein